MARSIAVLLVFLVMGCRQSISKEDLDMLNGYWEIKEVEFPTGESKEYILGTSIDFIFLDGNKGYRKKVQPNVLGGFETSDDAQEFELKTLEDSFLLVYQNNLTSWTERLIKLGENSLLISNEEGLLYSYKRFEPINLAE